MGVIAMGLLLWGMLLWESFKVNRVKLTLMRCPFTAQLGLCKVKNPWFLKYIPDSLKNSQKYFFVKIHCLVIHWRPKRAIKAIIFDIIFYFTWKFVKIWLTFLVMKLLFEKSKQKGQFFKNHHKRKKKSASIWQPNYWRPFHILRAIQDALHHHRTF